MADIDLEPLREEIRRRGLMNFWGDSLFPLSADERIDRAKKRALQARDNYLRIMSSPRNDNSDEFRRWAIKKALGLKTSRSYTAQPTGGRNWRAWGKDRVIDTGSIEDIF